MSDGDRVGVGVGRGVLVEVGGGAWVAIGNGGASAVGAGVRVPPPSVPQAATTIANNITSPTDSFTTYDLASNPTNIAQTYGWYDTTTNRISGKQMPNLGSPTNNPVTNAIDAKLDAA